MAEVPEVEIIVRDLQHAVVGRRLDGAEVLVPAAVRLPAPSQLAERLKGRQVVAARRRAKFILLALDDGQLLAIHFMLWGELSLRPGGTERPEATLVVFALEGGDELRLSDTLGYARVALGPAEVVAETLKLAELGPEVLDATFTAQELLGRLRRRRSPLKTVLLNQRILAGLGNRDADESLWRAGLDPRRLASSLTSEEGVRLHHAIRDVLEEGLSLRGTQKDLFGVQGKARHRRNVFGRTGAPCPRCATPISHLRIGGRNTHWCAACQPENGTPTTPSQSSLL